MGLSRAAEDLLTMASALAIGVVAVVAPRDLVGSIGTLGIAVGSHTMPAAAVKVAHINGKNLVDLVCVGGADLDDLEESVCIVLGVSLEDGLLDVVVGALGVGGDLASVDVHDPGDALGLLGVDLDPQVLHLAVVLPDQAVPQILVRVPDGDAAEVVEVVVRPLLRFGLRQGVEDVLDAVLAPRLHHVLYFGF